MAEKAGEELVTEYVDLGAVKANTDGFVAEIARAKAAYESLAKAKVDIGLAKSLADVSKANIEAEKVTQALIKSQIELEKLKKQQVQTENELLKQAQLKEKAAQQELKTQKQIEDSKSKNTIPESVTNTGAVEEDIKNLEKKGDVLNDLNRTEAEAANSAYALGQAQQSGAKSTSLATKEDIALTKAREQLKKANSEQNVQLQGFNLQKQLANKAAKEEAQLALGLLSPYQLLSKQYNIAQLAAKDLAVQYGIGSKEAKLAAKEALAMNTQLQAIDKTVGQSQRNVGNYGGAIQKLLGPIRTLANILPGLGISGIFLLAFEAIQKAGDALGLFTNKTSVLNEVNQEAVKGYGQQVAKIEILQEKLNDLNVKQVDRIKYAKQYNEVADEGNKIDLTQINNLDLVNKKIEAQIGLIKQRALAKAAENIIAKKAEDLLQKQFDLEELLRDNPSINNEARDKIISQTNTFIAQVAKNRNEKLRLTAEEALAFASLPDEELNKVLAGDAKKFGILFDNRVRVYLRGLAKQKELIDSARKGERAGTGAGFIIAAEKDVEDAQKELDKYLEIVAKMIDPTSFVTKPGKKAGIDNLQTLKELTDNSFKIYEIFQKRKIANFERDLESDTIHYAEKLTIVDKFVNASLELIDRQEQEDIRVAQAKRDREIKNLEEEKSGKSLQEKARIDENIKILQKNTQKDITTINLEAEDKRTVIYQNGMDKRNKILKEELKRSKDLYDEYAKYEEDILNDTLKRYKNALDEREKQEIEAHKKELELFKELQQKKIELAKSAGDFLLSLASSGYDKQLNLIAQLKDAIDEQKERDLAANDARVQSEQDKAANIIIINQRALVEKEKLDRKAKEIELNKAKFDRAAQIFEIAIQTIKSVAEIKAKAAALVSPNVALAPIYAALKLQALAQIPFVLATSALSIGSILAKPLPRLFKGKRRGESIGGQDALLNDHPDGNTMEVLEHADGSIEFPEGRNVVRNIKTSDTVHPDRDAWFRDVILRAAYKDSHPSSIGIAAASETAVLLRKQNKILEKIVNKKPVFIKIEGNNFKYIAENTNWNST